MEGRPFTADRNTTFQIELELLAVEGRPFTADRNRAAPMQAPQEVAAGFKPASRTRVAEILETLTALGQTRQVEDRYSL